MKKFLSLVLALVMTMSLVTISAGAEDFTDDASITYKEAVDVMSAIGVVGGYDDGSFNPTAGLSRGAAAKIICNMILGPTTAGALSADTAPYSDVAVDNTYAGYIAYCAQQGIISGYADGTFRPYAPLTNYAFMKMLLGALGYDPEIEGFVGANWSIQVAKLALAIGLDDGLVGTLNGTAAATREEACLYALNAMTSAMVDYDSRTSVTVGGAEVVIAGSKAKEVVNNAKTETIASDDVLQFAEKYFDDLKLTGGTDDFARPANIWRLKAEKIGTYAKTPDLSYTAKVEAGNIYADLGLGSKVEADDVTVYVNGIENEDLALEIKKGSENKVANSGNGVLTEVFYDDDTDTIIIVRIDTYVGQINKTVAATAKKDAYVVIDELDVHPANFKDEFETDEEFEDDAYVLYTYSDSAKAIKSVELAEKVTGTVSKVINKVDNLDQNNGLTIDDVAYKTAVNVSGEKLGDITVKEDVEAYLDAYGYVIYAEEVEEIGDYALVLQTAAKGTFVGNKAELVFADGTKKVVDTDKNYSDGKLADQIANNTIVTYRVDEDGNYVLKPVKLTQKAEGSTTFEMKNDKAGITTGTADGDSEAVVNANSATTFVVYDANDDDWTAYTGIKTAPSIAANTGAKEDVDAYWYCKSGKMVTVMFVVTDTAVEIVDDNNKLLWLAAESVSDLIHDADGDYFEYNAVVNGEITTVKVAETATVNGTSADGETLGNELYKSFTTDKYGIITGVKSFTAFDNTTDAKQALNDGVGVDKVSKEYTVILDTADKNYTITVDDNADFFSVDEDGEISDSSYASVSKDENDIVYAVVQDWLVKTLITVDVDDDVVVNPNITIDTNSAVVIEDTVYVDVTLSTYKKAQAIEAALIAAGYTDIEIDATSLDTTAKDGSIKVTFAVNPTAKTPVVGYATVLTNVLSVGINNVPANSTIGFELYAGDELVASGERAFKTAYSQVSCGLYKDGTISSDWSNGTWAPAADKAPDTMIVYINGVAVSTRTLDLENAPTGDFPIKWSAWVK